MLRLIIRIITAFAASLILSLWVIQNSAKLQDSIGTTIVQFIEKDWSARITMQKPRINFFTFSIYLAEGTVTPTDSKKYSWHFEECRIYVSPLALLMKKRAELHLTLNKVTASTDAHDTTIDIVEHIKQMLAPSTLEIPITLESLCINNLDATLRHSGQTFTAKTPGTLAIQHDNDLMRFKEQTWHGSFAAEKALLCVNNVPYAQEFSGVTTFHLDEKQNGWQFSSNMAGKLPIIDHRQEYALDGTWNQDGGEIMLTSGGNQTRLAITFSYPLTIGLKGVFPANHVNQAVHVASNNLTDFQAIGGTCAVDTVLTTHNNTFVSSGTVSVDRLKIGSLELAHAGMTLIPSDAHKTVDSAIVLDQSPGYGMVGSLDWNTESRTGCLTLTNTQKIVFMSTAGNNSGYEIKPKACSLKLSYDSQGSCRGSYAFDLNNPAYKKIIKHRGIIAYKKNKIGIKGKDAHGSYELKACLLPHPHLMSIEYTKDDKKLLCCSTNSQHPLCLEGSVSWLFLKRFLDQQYRRMIFSNDGSLFLSIDQHNTNAITAEISLDQGSFYMPEYHNILKAFSTSLTVQPHARRLELNNMHITMSKGEITCPHAIAQLDEQYNLSFLMAPWKLDNVFVNWKKDFYGFLYGTLTLSKQETEAAMLKGSLILKKSILKDSFLQEQAASASYNSMPLQLSFPIGFDLKLITEKPIKAKIGNFNTAARVDLSVVSAPQKDFFGAPIVTGSIELDKGSLRILNKSLDIQYGKLQFLHNNLQDPLIDLMARSRIGKYLVSLQATGSLQKPNILLESTPALSEEQIIGLLLTGSELSSLQADLPAMLLQNLDALIFTTKRSGKEQSVLDTITKTFKYVQITPNLNTVPGERGMLRGSFTVNLTDQLRAKIDKDLDLQKNFSAQIEYLLSDNINLKLVQEQRGERGLEVEFRIKP
jgi:hypothetical protein